jgi:TolB protein
MEGIRSPLKLTATAKGGAAVELRFENTGRGPVSIPKDPKLFAPVLWAEVEGEGTDSVLLSPDDYLLTKFSNPYKDMQNIAPGGAATVTVELPTGPVPPGATLRWALNNHVKPLAGSLPAGECEARLLFRPAKDIIVMSNPVRVTGRAGGAGPAQLAGLDRPPAYAPVVDPKPDTPLPPLAEQLKGRIWFDTDRDGNWEIYAMDANGSNSVNVSRSPDTDEFGVAVSPDGKRIAYQAGGRKSGDGGYWGRSSPDGKAIWVADSGGGNARKIAENAINPAWWPDGTALLYSSKKDGYCMQNLETGAVTQLLREVSGWLNFSPSGFCPGTRQVLGGGGLNTTLCGMTVVVDLDERARFRDFRALTTTYRGCTQRWLSPAGRRVIFAHHDPKHNGAIILWSTSPDGTDPRRFARTGESWPGYGSYGESPDGTLYVAASWGNLYVGRYADGAQKQLTNKQGSNMSPVWTAAAVPPGRK